MEILKTIWNALTNENELILILTGIPMIFIEMTLTLLLFTTILNISFNRKQGIIYVICNVLLGLVTSYLISAPYNTFINLVAFPVLVYFILKTNALKSILAEITFYIIIFCVGSPLAVLFSQIFKSNLLMAVPIYKMLYSISLYAVLFILYKVLKKFNLRIIIFDKFDSSDYNMLIINFIVGILAIAIQAYVEYMYIDYLPNSLIAASMIILIIYFCISLYSLFRTSKLEQTKKLLESEKMYNKTLTTLHDNIRGFKHDFHNIVQAIGGYISDNNMGALKAYYKDMFGDCQVNNNLTALNPELINNPVIYSLLVDKYYKSEEAGIKMNIEVFTDLSSLNIKMYELTRILGILFDNAIEASSKCENKTVNITFKKDKSRNKTLIIIQNTYINKDINIDKIFEKGYTSKEDDKNNKSHGLGLWEVRKYLKKNQNLDLYTTKNNEYFTQQFEIYN